MAKLVKKIQNGGAGMVLQVLGFILLFLFPIGTVIGIVLLICGSSLSKKLICSDCGNKIEDKGVKLCPVCKASFQIK